MGSSSDAVEPGKNLQELLNQYRRNLHRLEMQIASHGGEMSAPLHLLNQRDETQKKIAELEAKAQRFAVQRSTTAQPLAEAEGQLARAPIRVFISSTMKDLQAERDAVENALTSLDLQAVRAETIGSQSASPYEVSLMMAQNCDIYLGIYGGRYGTIVPNDGRSITEIEYHTARQTLGRPILIYRKTDVSIEPEQAEFLKFAGDLVQGHTWREFTSADVPETLAAYVQQDVRAEIERHLEWENRLPARERVLLASLGLSPGAVTGLYRALARARRPVTRVATFSPTNRDVRDAAGICTDEFRRLSVPYRNHYLDAQDIDSDASAQEFKGTFNALLQEALADDAEVVVGITGGRTIMGVLMGIVAQTTITEESAQRVTLYHLDVDDDIEEDGRLPKLMRFKSDARRWQQLLNPPGDKCRLIKVPYVHIPPPN